MTPQRQLVLDAVRTLKHATPDQICQQVRQTTPSVNVTTIYRTLELLERLGLVRHTHLGHGAPSYSAEEHKHLHLVCHRCGQVLEQPNGLLAAVAERLRTECGFELDANHLALSGTCRECLEGQE
jgi:Fur family transcriptional regulator, ferric uptake regulator